MRKRNFNPMRQSKEMGSGLHSSEILIYCEVCDDGKSMRIDPMRSDDLNGDKIWGDLCCSECHLVIATIEVPEAGIYEFTKARDC